MAAIMVVYMNLSDDAWIDAYFAEVPKLLAEYGAESIAGSRDVRRIEGDRPPPDRMAVLSFPSMEAIDRFMADERYRIHRTAREAGAASQIFVFENGVAAGELV